MLPLFGVYATRTRDSAGGRRWASVTNVGCRPTFNDCNHLTIETYLLDAFDGQAPERIRVEFLTRLREERRFDSPEELRAQILKDVARARKYFRLARLC